MGITVVSTASAVSALPGLPGSSQGDPGAIDFAALLGEQLAGTFNQLLPGQAADAQRDEASSEEATLSPEQLADLAALDPALAAQILPMLPQKPANTTVDRENLAEMNRGISEQTLPAITEALDDSSANKQLLSEIGALANTNNPQTAALDSANQNERFATDLAKAMQQGQNSLSTSQGKAAPPTTTLAAAKLDPSLAALPESANIAAELPPAPTSSASFGTTLSASTAQMQAQRAEQASSNIPTPIHETRWAQDFGEKVVWMAKSELQSAQISINPPQLGPMQISINLSGDQASAIFASPHAEVRQAIEDAMPRLREMLSAAGISLGEANVGTQLPQQNRDNAPQFSNSPANGARFADENAILPGDAKAVNTLPIQRGRGLVDLFA